MFEVRAVKGLMDPSPKRKVKTLPSSLPIGSSNLPSSTVNTSESEQQLIQMEGELLVKVVGQVLFKQVAERCRQHEQERQQQERLWQVLFSAVKQLLLTLFCSAYELLEILVSSSTVLIIKVLCKVAIWAIRKLVKFVEKVFVSGWKTFNPLTFCWKKMLQDVWWEEKWWVAYLELASMNNYGLIQFLNMAINLEPLGWKTKIRINDLLMVWQKNSLQSPKQANWESWTGRGLILACLASKYQPFCFVSWYLIMVLFSFFLIVRQMDLANG